MLAADYKIPGVNCSAGTLCSLADLGVDAIELRQLDHMWKECKTLLYPQVPDLFAFCHCWKLVCPSVPVIGHMKGSS
ncbi:MAG: hypothetical protein ACLSA6_04135 [Holdemania massiliensis]